MQCRRSCSTSCIRSAASWNRRPHQRACEYGTPAAAPATSIRRPPTYWSVRTGAVVGWDVDAIGLVQGEGFARPIIRGRGMSRSWKATAELGSLWPMVAVSVLGDWCLMSGCDSTAERL